VPLGSSGGISTLAASITEEGGSQILNSNNGNANALNGLTSITSAGALTIGGIAFTDAGSFSNAGSLTILSGEGLYGRFADSDQRRFADSGNLCAGCES